MPTALFFRPDVDVALKYGKSWLGVGIEEAVKRGFNIIDLVDEAATFQTLKQTIENEKIDAVILLGHGNASVFTGFEQQIVFRACTNDEIMAGSISHFVSCSVGQELLPSIIKKGGIWTVGYQVDFQFLINPEYSVEQDPLAEPFKNVTVAIIQKMLDGAKLKDVWNAGIAECDRWIAKLWNRPELDWAQVIGALQHDRDGMIGLGSEEAYIPPPVGVTVTKTAPLIVLGVAAWILLTS
ncbi:hypothetical protein CH330_01295 [candidate division WOR-3 bacterium JGI_Cruoil_03_51_56]|uniref:Leucine-binding protein domain-containing protein n=1 Tax=candidate division WOR-3 bacterium JGI_Cruoil_03_51_56 TaxID=1973747 RepID=A0A235BXF2_UNCW3|nr:MAG: hypothetical protein CH330_01295 [candidate division WOR-3 bacterium JGI_Cruoil_03_51_56]